MACAPDSNSSTMRRRTPVSTEAGWFNVSRMQPCQVHGVWQTRNAHLHPSGTTSKPLPPCKRTPAATARHRSSITAAPSARIRGPHLACHPRSAAEQCAACRFEGSRAENAMSGRPQADAKQAAARPVSSEVGAGTVGGPARRGAPRPRRCCARAPPCTARTRSRGSRSPPGS